MTTERPQPNDIKERLVIDFSQWVASCAVTPGIYSALDGVDFDPLFDAGLGRIGADEFERWHEAAVAELCRILPGMGAGWAAKAINEYLKTRCYVGGYGREGLADAIHPPIDNGLIIGLRREFADDPNLGDALASLSPMASMDDYAKYADLIAVCRRVAQKTGCSLMESEIYWE